MQTFTREVRHTFIMMRDDRGYLPFSSGQPWRGMRVTVFGLAREGTALARFLAEREADVVVTDCRGAQALIDRTDALSDLPIRFALGGHPDWVLDADVIFVSPGIPREIPPLVEAKGRGIRLSSETELFFSLSPVPIIEVTGSSGKTTTTTLVGHILEAAGERTWMGGNIGEPLLGIVDQIRPTDRVVLELSSFQLEHLGASPHTAAILNVTPNHLDRHDTMERYIRAKQQIIQHQVAGDVALFGYDDPLARRLSEVYAESHPDNTMAYFSGATKVDRGAYLDHGKVVIVRDGTLQTVSPVEEVRLRGWHNVLNVLAACALAAEAGAPVEAMRQVVTTFAGVAHRLEFVRALRGVQYVNDSIATTPERSIAALQSYEEPIVLLAGGRDKHLSWDAWADLVLRKVRHLILFGEAADLIERAIGAAFERAAQSEIGPVLEPGHLHRAGSLENAVELAARLAYAGDVVLLSPGGTSYDAYVDFVERGLEFRALVKVLGK